MSISYKVCYVLVSDTTWRLLVFYSKQTKSFLVSFILTFYFILEFQVLGTYERSAVTSSQTGRRGATRIKAYTSVLNRNVNKWVYTHEEGPGTCSACSSQL